MNANFYSAKYPVIENGKLVLITNGGSREIIGIRYARKQLAELEAKKNLLPSSIERRDTLRKAVALWSAQ